MTSRQKLAIVTCLVVLAAGLASVSATDRKRPHRHDVAHQWKTAPQATQWYPPEQWRTWHAARRGLADDER